MPAAVTAGTYYIERGRRLLDRHLLDRAQHEYGAKGIRQLVDPGFEQSARLLAHGGALRGWGEA